MNKTPAIPMSLIAVIALAVGGAFLINGPLDNRRPTPRSIDHSQSFGIENVNARLWQDPLDAIKNHINEHTETHNMGRNNLHLFSTLAGEISRKNKIVIMPVMIPGGGYAEDQEQRRRTRKAVLSGLGVSGFAPDDESHIGYISSYWSWDENEFFFPPKPFELSNSKKDSTEISIPFEWFSLIHCENKEGPNSNQKYENVLVLWIDESKVKSWVTPILNSIMKKLVTKNPDHVDIHVIGPSSSTTLLAMMKQADYESGQTIRGLVKKLARENFPHDEDLAEAKFLIQIASLFANIGQPLGSTKWKSPGSDDLQKIQAICVKKDHIIAGLNDEEVRAISIILTDGGYPKDKAFYPIPSPKQVVLHWQLALQLLNSKAINHRTAMHRSLTDKLWSPKIISAKTPQSDFKMTFHSCRSTASEQHLLSKSGAEKGIFKDQFSATVGATFQRSITTDDDLIEELFIELTTRGIDLNNSNNHVALIGEWDSFYGRSFPKSFNSVMARNSKAHSDSSSNPKDEINCEPMNEQLHQLSYLKGLDGVVPGTIDYYRTTKSTNSSKQGNSNDFLSKPEDSAWPFGRNQLDNIQRLATMLKIRETEVSGSIRLIGIVGSDVYDKLLILQVLTPHFPNALFFTTDLDAQLLHPTQNAWTRNLIVLSSYGLTVKKDLQDFALPFRDSYQTATFIGILQALGEEQFEKDIRPRVFEIGSKSLINLSRNEESELYPPVPKIKLVWNNWRGKVLIPVGAIFLWWIMYGRPKVFINLIRIVLGPPLVHTKLFSLSFITLIVGFSGLYLFSVILWNHGGNEPINVIDGVSGWPIQYWRFGATIISIFFFIYTYKALPLNEEKIAQRFGLPSRNKISADIKIAPNLQKTLDYWHNYRDQLVPKSRYIRLAKGLVLFMGFMLALFFYYGLPVVYLRGQSLRLLHYALLLLSGVGTAGVTIFVLDAMIVCRQNIIVLAVEKTGWPNRISETYRSRLGVPLEYKEPVNQILDLEIIGENTRVVSNLLRWPFLLLFLMILSQNSIHEHWGPSPALQYGFGTLFMLTLISAIGLKRQASQARNYVRQNIRSWRFGCDPDAPTDSNPSMEKELVQMQDNSQTALAKQNNGQDLTILRSSPPLSTSSQNPDSPNTVSHSVAPDFTWIDRVSRHVESMDKGAFAPWYRHPIIQSVLLPISGSALVFLWQFLSQPRP